jgi:ATP-binding cassette, subfamily B, multidrug efflux pump
MTTTAPAPKGGKEMKQTERIEAPMGGPGRGPMGGGMVGQKAMSFVPSSKRMLRRMAPERNRALAVVGLAVVSVFLLALGPRLLGHATDLIFEAFLTRRPVDFDAVRSVLLQVVAVYVVGSALSWGQGYVLNDVVQGTVRRMRSDVEDKVNALPLEYFDKQPRGELMSRVTNDIDNVSTTLQQTMSQLLTSVLTVVAVLSMMLWISPVLALIALVSVPVSMYVTSRIMKHSQGQFIAQWRRTGRLNAHIEETFSGHALVTVFGRRAEVERAFAEENDLLYEASFKAQFVSGLIMPVMMFIGNLNYVVIAVVGGLRVANGQLSLGDVQAFIQYTRQFTQPLTTVASMMNLLQSGVASAERVFELLDADEQVPDPEVSRLAGARTSTTGEGEVRFEHVSFSYDPAEPLIEDLSLVASPGQTVAIVGPTGAGKTTLVNLVMRFYELDGGRITLDGTDITAMPRSALRGRIGMVLQDTWLFQGTIRDNIRYGRPEASEDDLLAAARATFVDRFVHSLPEGYDTIVDEDGGNLSAGERQLLTIARAFLADPALLILDEATSSVDTRTELLVQHAMAALRSDRTSFVIAHRLSTIRDADLILVMEAGRIVEQGDHDTLLAAGGAYARLYQSQFAAALA